MPLRKSTTNCGSSFTLAAWPAVVTSHVTLDSPHSELWPCSQIPLAANTNSTPLLVSDTQMAALFVAASKSDRSSTVGVTSRVGTTSRHLG